MNMRAETDSTRDLIQSRANRLLYTSVFVLVFASFAACLIGITSYAPWELFSDRDVAEVVLYLRLPRVLMAVIVGSALALSGAVYQALFRNSLASPFSLGVSSGAAVGAFSALLFGLAGLASGLGSQVAAMGGALASIAIILGVSKRSISRSGDSILLVGIIFSFFCSSILTLVQYLSDAGQLLRISRWMMGGIPVPQWPDLAIGIAAFSALVVWTRLHSRELDLMWFGDDLAAIKGVDVDKLYRSAFVVTSLVIGWIVSQCGVIGFVGIIVPAAIRIVTGLRHRAVVPLSIIGGALLVVVCDLIGRVVIPPFEVPVGVFTAVVGGPLFVAVLLNERRW